MVRSPAERVSDHVAAPSFETTASRSPQDEGGLSQIAFAVRRPAISCALEAEFLQHLIGVLTELRRRRRGMARRARQN